MSYLDKNRKDLYAKYPTLEAYKANFKVTDELMNQLIAAAEKEKIKKDEKGLAVSGEIIKLQMKALLARDLWKNDSYYEVINEINDAYKKALEVLTDDTFTKYKINSY